MQNNNCRICAIIPVLLGKHFFLPLFGRGGTRLFQREVEPLLAGLHLALVGGLARRGWTIHDIDVVGEQEDVSVLAERALGAGITHPIHYCGRPNRHSHLECVFFGIKLALTGRGY